MQTWWVFHCCWCLIFLPHPSSCVLPDACMCRGHIEKCMWWLSKISTSMPLKNGQCQELRGKKWNKRQKQHDSCRRIWHYWGIKNSSFGLSPERNQRIGRCKKNKLNTKEPPVAKGGINAKEYVLWSTKATRRRRRRTRWLQHTQRFDCSSSSRELR